MNDPAALTPGVRPLRRAAIRVRDLDRSLTLYRDGLGLQVWKHGSAASDHADFFRLLGLASGQARYAILQAEGSEVGMLGLFEVAGSGLAALPRQATGGMAVGEVAVVFLARDLHVLADRVHALGLVVICPPVAFRPPGGRVALEMTFRDFDGALVNLIESD